MGKHIFMNIPKHYGMISLNNAFLSKIGKGKKLEGKNKMT